jgi:CubicO group peptidase (beta-lactamase class C family)
MRATKVLILSTLLSAGIALPLHVNPASATDAKGDIVAGMSQERLARIGPAMKREIERGTFAGAVTLIARRGQIVHQEAHGFLDAAKTKAMTTDAIFMLASMTKPITSVAAMMMVEEGLMKVGDPISNWIPELKDVKVETRRTGPDGQEGVEDLPLQRPITVQDLLRHTSGFFYAGSVRSPRLKELSDKANVEGRDADITADEMLKRLGAIPLAHQPGTTFEYSISTDVLGLLLERVAKMPLDRIFKERIFDPLGMKDTAWFVSEDKRARLAETLDSDPQKQNMWKWYRITENPAGKQYFKGGAGLVSTAADYYRFAQMVANGGELGGKRLLSKKTVDYMLSNHTIGMAGSPTASTGPGYGFGLGFAVRLQDGFAVAPGTEGDAMWAGAWGTSFTIDPKEQLVAVLLAQTPSNRFHTRMLFKNLIYAAMVESEAR